MKQLIALDEDKMTKRNPGAFALASSRGQRARQSGGEGQRGIAPRQVS